jgi:hypothetical protein
MGKEMDLNFNEMCRLCARKCEDMQNIFHDIPAETEMYVDVTKELLGMLAFKITDVTSIKVLYSRKTVRVYTSIGCEHVE